MRGNFHVMRVLYLAVLGPHKVILLPVIGGDREAEEAGEIAGRLGVQANLLVLPESAEQRTRALLADDLILQTIRSSDMMVEVPPPAGDLRQWGAVDIEREVGRMSSHAYRTGKPSWLSADAERFLRQARSAEKNPKLLVDLTDWQVKRMVRVAKTIAWEKQERSVGHASVAEAFMYSPASLLQALLGEYRLVEALMAALVRGTGRGITMEEY